MVDRSLRRSVARNDRGEMERAVGARGGGERMMYDQLAISESRSATAGGKEAARVLAEAAFTAGLQRFVEPETVADFLARVEFVSKTFPESSTPSLNDDDVRESLVALSDGLKSFAELRAAAREGALIEALRQ